MSEESPENYNSGDVVWVKLGSSWWPGEVKDLNELPSDVLDFKKPPLAVVKFFDEDSYEYVKSWTNIYPYNCEKKNEFIKKGMAAFRAKTPHMEKFPKDVLTAEGRMGGNPNILSEPMFLPEKKRNYVAEVFGTPSPKNKGNKEKKRSSTSKSNQKDTAHITHRRFLGVDDYRVYICIQYPGKDRVPGDREDEEVLRINKEPEQEFNCHSCSFTTKRLEVMILHTKSHIQGVYVSSPRKTKHPAVRRKKEKVKKSRNSEDIMDSDSSSSDSDYVREKKRKPKTQGARKSKVKKPEKPKEEPKTSSDIRSELLAVWDDSDEDEDFDLSLNTSTATDQNLTQSINDIILGSGNSKKEPPNETTQTADESETVDKTQEVEAEKLSETAETALSQTVSEEPAIQEAAGESKPNDEELNQSEVLNQPVKELNQPVKESNQPADDPAPAESEPDGLKPPVEEPEDKTLDVEEPKDGETSKDAEEDAEKSKQKMDKDIQEAIKSCFDFDEDEEDDNAIMNKATAGRKIPRVIPPAGRRKSEEEPDEEELRRERILKESEQFNRKTKEETAAARGDDVDATFKELMEMTTVPELPDVHPANTLKCEQNFHKIKTIKFPDKPEAVPAKPEKKEPSETASKLINPKKRFVKSFEDFEQMQNELRRREEQMDSPPKMDAAPEASADQPTEYSAEEDVADTTIELSKLKSKIMSKIIEEAKINEESRCKIMSKMQEKKPEETEAKASNANEEVRTGTSHWTPRSKILELYRNDTNKHKAEDEQKAEREPVETHVIGREATADGDRLREILTRKEAVPPKKSKWSRRGSHPKKDRNAFILEEVRLEDIPLPNEERRETESIIKADQSLESAPAPNSAPSASNDDYLEEPKPIIQHVEITKEEPAGEKPAKEESNKLPQVEEESGKLPPAGEEKDKLPPVEEERDKVPPVEEERDKLPPVEEESNKSPAEEESLKVPPVPEEIDSKEEEEEAQTDLQIDEHAGSPEKPIAGFEVEEETTQEKPPEVPVTEEIREPSQSEETVKEPPQNEETAKDPPQSEETAEDPPQDEETAKEPPQNEEAAKEPPQNETAKEPPQNEAEKSPLKEEVSSPKEEVQGLPEEDEKIKVSSEEEETEVGEEKAAGATEETDTSSTPDPNVQGLDEDLVAEAAPKDTILPADESKECEESTPEAAVVDMHNIKLEEIPLPPPIKEVPSPVGDLRIATPKKDTSPVPKRNKKRKMSESLPATDEPKEEVAADEFSPVEKKKKETSEGNKEPVSETDTIGGDSLREHKSVLNDMEAAKDDVATPKPAQAEAVVEHKNKLEIQCGSSSPESFKFSIQTNLSNLTSREEISALALATLSEIKADLENSDSGASEEKAQREKTALPPPVPAESELVPIEGNLTVVSERDLADGQVEITSEQVISPAKKPVTLSNFSMDFSDSASDSNSTCDTLADFGRNVDFNAKGTEFTSKAITKEIRKVDRKKENAYERLELINILEGNSDTERKPLSARRNVVDDICDFEEHIPSQIVCAKKLKRDGSIEREYPFTEKAKSTEKSTASKLLERLTTSTSKSEAREPAPKLAAKNQAVAKGGRSHGKLKLAASKPIIISEQIVKPAEPKTKPKKTLNDIEDVEAFVIHKDPKMHQIESEASDAGQSTKTAGKAKILQQTIITPAGEIIQPTVNQAQSDETIFDINSMPIVLSDEILTPESIENMPIMIGSETKTAEPEKPAKRLPQGRIIAKTAATPPQPTTSKNQIVAKHSKTPRILQTVGSKVIKNSPLLPNTAKPGKYIILPQSGVQAAKYVATKKSPVMKRSSIVPKVPTAIAPEPSGNKIMIVTNQQGQQQRLLLTPAQQKMLGYQNQKTKTIVKGNVMQKSVLAAKSVPLIEPSTSGVISKSPGIGKVVVGTSPSAAAGLLATTAPQTIANQGRVIKGVTKKLHPVSQKVFPNTNKTQKTILIKDQHGQTVRKIQGTDDELLDKQVAEQIEAIKASSGMKFSTQPKQAEPFKVATKAQLRRSYSKKAEAKPKPGPPPLAGIQPSKPETISTLQVAKKAEPAETKTATTFVAKEAKPAQERPLNQLVIQDAVGNQTTITEGQILALPSETVDGQPQSYMLVTLDESGNLTPLNSEALMSLDPNLGLGGDLSNMVLQIDQGALSDRPQALAVKASVGSEPPKLVEMEPAAAQPVAVPEPSVTTEIAEAPVDQKAPTAVEAAAAQPSTNGDPGQQLIVTGDPIATQKFLESLTEGTTDLANILANAEGNSILIQADGQQILINTNSDNQMLLSVNNDSLNVSESTEGGGNPIFATQPSKNQDILAAALADTDVFQQEQHAAQGKITSQLSPNNTLYPMNVGNVLETSLTLSSPIMTPLEVPSTNNKKIPDDEADILTQVPKNVDLPITITDPNISQTVANQQAAALTNLELSLPASETAISSVSTEMNSPSYVYSLPALDESVDITQKPFNSSMPLLNEDIEETASKPKEAQEPKTAEDKPKNGNRQGELTSDGSFLDEEEGRFTLGGEMCSSLSEPPPEMFDLPEEMDKRRANIPPSLQSTPEGSDNADMTDASTQAESSNEGSCEIPLQPPIVTKSLNLSENLKRSLHDESDEEGSKKCKFD